VTEDAVDPDEASALLGLTHGADAGTLRRRFRELARELHPDRGGDPAAFAEVRRAYALLRADAEDATSVTAPAAPRVARGRPSRPASTARASPLLADGAAAALVAALDARPVDRAGLVVLRLVSAAPGARRNRFAAALPASAVAVLELRVAGEDEAGPGRGPEAGPGPRSGTGAGPAPGAGAQRAALRLSARGRTARRRVTALRLDGPVLGGAWTRHRTDGAVELRAAPRPREDTRAAGTAAAASAAAGLLAALGWPLDQWSEDSLQTVAPPPKSVARRAVSGP